MRTSRSGWQLLLPLWAALLIRGRGGFLDQLAENSRDAAHPEAEKGVMTFYAYRAASAEDYPPENVNMGNLEGVLWYLHHEVVPFCPRRFMKTRILRFKIDYKPTPELISQGMSFGWRWAFDAGACSDYNGQCASMDYRKNGFVIGCNNFGDTWSYPGDQAWGWTHDGKNMTFAYQSGIWYSIPGPCPGRKWWDTNSTCSESEPGGQCDAPTGADNCTYSIESRGEVILDDVIGQGVHGVDLWWCDEGCREFTWQTDAGICCSWWDGFWDVPNSTQRLDAVKEAFRSKYPTEPDLPDPVCDFTNPPGYFRSV